MSAASRSLVYQNSPVPAEASASGVSWAAVVAGAFVAAALSLILLALGAGTGLSSLSPWINSGAPASAVKIGALIWIALTEIISAGVGGYLAGRLRTKWTGVHTDEVYFRDTAHGFLVWAVALVISGALLTTASSAMVGASMQTGSRADESRLNPNDYFVNSLFRSSQPLSANETSARAQTSVIFAHALAQGTLTDDDKNYVADQVAAATGIHRADAEQRVSDTFERDQQAADAARKAIAHSLYWLFVASLIGAFCASYAALLGGRQRDRIRA
ncbi:MAG: hypothetical protein WCC21_10495 [Candidatus Acidiferrales bacterium]